MARRMEFNTTWRPAMKEVKRSKLNDVLLVIEIKDKLKDNRKFVFLILFYPKEREG